MSKSSKVVIVLGAAIAVAGIAATYFFRKKECNTMLDMIADEGYETAHDVLFPNKGRKGKNLHYGPVHHR